jgi:hypothetical protein
MTVTPSTLKRVLIDLLLRGYPKAWREEYGPELEDVLIAQPLNVKTMGNVVGNGIRQRVRSADITTYLGVSAMLVVATEAVWTVVVAPPSTRALTGLLQESSKTLPTVVVKPLISEFYVLFLVGCGCAIHVLRGGKASQSGVAAMKITFIAGIPVMVLGMLMLARMLGTIVMGPGDTSAWSVFLAPIFRLPECWIWGCVGGGVGRMLLRLRRNPVNTDCYGN